jgi:hypothetical protein
MTPQERQDLEAQLNRVFDSLPGWGQKQVKNGMQIPEGRTFAEQLGILDDAGVVAVRDAFIEHRILK